MIRIIAVLMLLIPGLISAYGIKLMRDTLFNEFYPIFLRTEIQFIVGFLIFIGGISFIGGYIVYRDRKKQQKKQNRNNDD